MTPEANVRLFDLEDASDSVASALPVLDALARSHSLPIGWIQAEAHDGRVETDRLRQQAALAYPARVVRSAIRDSLAGAWPTPGSPVSVVICTRDRPARLERCLRAVTQLDYPAYEVIVVDNAPSDDATKKLAAGFGVRYVVEPVPGLDHARNRGIAESVHDLIAFTDDDTRPDSLWLRHIARAFTVPDVMAVTGLVVPLSLETEAERLFEFSYGGMVQALDRRTARGRDLSGWDLLWSSAYGAGANMAFRREVFESVGTFDPCLDVGTPAGGGGDLDMFHRVLANGHTLVYEPAAIVQHEHRADMRALRRQLFDNGRGFCVYLMTCARNRTVRPLLILDFALRAWLRGWVLRRLFRPFGFPRRLVVAELLGTLSAPYYYLASRRSHRRTSARSG
jgi:glycosyltransferase involved in cell wall biosynthesis